MSHDWQWLIDTAAGPLGQGLGAATVLALAGWGFTAFARRAPAVLRLVLWRGVLAAFWLAPLAVFSANALHLPTLAVTAPVPVAAPAQTVTDLSSPPPVQAVMPVPPEAERPSQPMESLIPHPASQSLIPHPRPRVPLPVLLLALWLAGAALSGLALLRDLWSVRQLRQTARPVAEATLLERVVHWSAQLGLRRPVRLAESEAVGVPVLVGLWRPVLLLPPGFAGRADAAAQEAALVHELAHLRQGDLGMLALARLTCVLLWWHPLVWLTAARLRATAEEVCDDWAVALTATRQGYAEALVQLAEAATASAGGLACGRQGRGLVRRVQRILTETHPPVVRVSRRGRLTLAIGAGVLLLAVGVLRLTAEKREVLLSGSAEGSQEAAIEPLAVQRVGDWEVQLLDLRETHPPNSLRIGAMLCLRRLEGQIVSAPDWSEIAENVILTVRGKPWRTEPVGLCYRAPNCAPIHYYPGFPDLLGRCEYVALQPDEIFAAAVFQPPDEPPRSGGSLVLTVHVGGGTATFKNLTPHFVEPWVERPEEPDPYRLDPPLVAEAGRYRAALTRAAPVKIEQESYRGQDGLALTMVVSTREGRHAPELEPFPKQAVDDAGYTLPFVGSSWQPDTGMFIYTLVHPGPQARSLRLFSVEATGPTEGEYRQTPSPLTFTFRNVPLPRTANREPATAAAGTDASNLRSNTTITGIVTDADTGQPLANVELRVKGQTRAGKPWGWKTVQTDAGGRYTLAVAEDIVRLLFQRNGWVPAEVKPVRLVSGQTKTVDVRMDRGATVKGVIRPVPGEPLPPDLRVKAVQKWGRVQWARVADGGSYEVTGLMAGPCWLEVEVGDGYGITISTPASDTLEVTIREPHQVITWDALQLVKVRTLAGHGGEIKAVAFSPDGKTVLSAALDFRVRLWDLHTGTLKQTLGGDIGEGGIWCAAFSPNGQIIAGGASQGEYDSGTGEVKLWDRHTGKLKRTLRPHGEVVVCLAFSPDGKTLASGAQGDTSIKLWDVNTGKVKRTLKGHQFKVTSVAFSPDGQTLASGSEDKTVKLWDARTGQLKRTLGRHTDRVQAVAFAPDGQTLASGGSCWTGHFQTYSGEVKLWDVQTGRLKRSLTVRSGGVQDVAFSPDGKQLAYGTFWYQKPATVAVWDWPTGKREKRLLGSVFGRPTVAFSPDGKTLAIGHDMGVTLWEVSQ